MLAHGIRFKDKFLELVEKGMDDEAKFCARTVDQMCSLYMQAATQCAQVALKEFIEEEDLMDNSVKKK